MKIILTVIAAFIAGAVTIYMLIWAWLVKTFHGRK